MDLSGRPLLDTKADRELFAGRGAELSRLLSSIKRRQNVLLIGERGAGKTTVLRQLAFELRSQDPDNAPAFVEGSLATDPKTFIDLVRIRFGLEPLVLGPTLMNAAFGGLIRRPVLADSLELPSLIAALRDAAPQHQRVVLVDELPSSIGQVVFGRLRDELWQVPLNWVVSCSEDAAGGYLSPPSDTFFDVVMRLGGLSPEEQKEILQARAGRGGGRLASKLNEGNPRRLLELARESLEGGSETPELIHALNRRDAGVSLLGRAASMMMAELESLGPASASDERLLKRLGWTRPRAVQVLRRLEEKGLVTSTMTKGEAGRPRKLYRPTELSEYPVKERNNESRATSTG